MWSSQSMFHLPLERIQLTAPDVGGGFGMKNFLSPEWVLVLWAARRLGRPVKWVAERTEEFVAGTQGRDNHTRARLALDEDSRFLGLDVSTVANLGAYLSSNGPGSSTNSPATAMGGVYAIPAIFMDVRGTFTNTVPIDAYRGSGWGRPGYRSGALRAHRLRPRLGSVAERFADGLHAAPSRRSAPFDITLAELPTSANPLGVKGSGQAGCIAAPQTIINAIVDALAPLGIEHLDMPATPERVWRDPRSATVITRSLGLCADLMLIL